MLFRSSDSIINIVAIKDGVTLETVSRHLLVWIYKHYIPLLNSVIYCLPWRIVAERRVMYVVKRQDFVLEVAFLGWRMGGPPWLAAGRFSVAGCKAGNKVGMLHAIPR